MTFSFADLPESTFAAEPRFEALLDGLVADFRSRDPRWENLTSADPAMKLLEVMAAQEVLEGRQLNAAVRSLLLGSAAGADLDWLVAKDGITRLQNESDEDLRQRTILIRRSSSTAGTPVRYAATALASDPRVQDVAVNSGDDGTVRVTVLSRETAWLAAQTESDTLDAAARLYSLLRGNGETDALLRHRVQDLIDAAGPAGTPTGSLLTAVDTVVGSDFVRSLNDTIQVWPAEIQVLNVEATLWRDTFSSSIPSLDSIAAAFRALFGQSRLGRSVARSWIVSRLHVQGIERVELTSPVADVPAASHSAISLGTVNLHHGTVDA